MADSVVCRLGGEEHEVSRLHNPPFSDGLGLISISFTGTAGVPPAPVAVKVFSNKVASTVTAGVTPAVPVKSCVVEKGLIYSVP